jgi:fatty acid desaturase
MLPAPPESEPNPSQIRAECEWTDEPGATHTRSAFGGGAIGREEEAMRLRHAADVRTLIWAFVFMPAVLALHYARPSLAGWTTPLSFYLAYCAGVIAHNHNHCPTFVGRRANDFLSAWLSVFYGYPTFAWIPTHNQNHHRFVNRPGDATITWRARRENGALSALTFFFVSAAAQRPLIGQFLGDARRRSAREYLGYTRQYWVLLGGHASACILAMALYGGVRGAAVYVCALGAPALAALWGLMFTNYLQHVDCDPWSDWNHSRNFVSGWMNALVFDNGFHTVHHRRPGLHWSLLRAEHRRLSRHIDPRLEERSIVSYCFKAYVLGRTADRRAAPALLPRGLPSRRTRTPSR